VREREVRKTRGETLRVPSRLSGGNSTSFIRSLQALARDGTCARSEETALGAREIEKIGVLFVHCTAATWVINVTIAV